MHSLLQDGENKPILVAELSINHLGMVEIAKKMIKAAQDAGADVVKLKMKNVEEYYEDESKKWRNFNFIKYRKSLELSREDFKEINNYCEEIGIPWFATVHDKESRDFIREFNPPFYKVASMDSGKKGFVEETIEICKEEEKSMIVSMGGKSATEEKRIIEQIKDKGVGAFILHCVSLYPTPAEKCNIVHMKDMKDKHSEEEVRIGYSGHEKGIHASILAAVFGARMIERHLALSRKFRIHHIDAAITPKEFKRMNEIITKIGKNLSTGYETMEKEELEFIDKKKYS